MADQSMAKAKETATCAAFLIVAIFATVVFLGAPHTNNSPGPGQESSSSSSAAAEPHHLPLPLAAPRSSPAAAGNRPESDGGIDRPRSKYTPRRRRLSNALPNGGCEITWPAKPPPGVEITYAASYPGCGARMTWNLVEALTGLWTGDDWNNNGRGEEVVTVKTHYPQSNGILVDFDERIKRGFIVIRNPMKSIPSFFNHIYEMRNHLPVHSERAPLEEWLKWRNAYLDTEIAEYKKFICYWMDRYSAENRLLITYEGLTDDLIGAEVTKGLNDFLGQVEGVNVIDRESVPCIWRAVVKNEPPPQQKAQIEKLQSMAINQPQGAPPVVVKPQQQQRRQTESPQLVDPDSAYASDLDQQLLDAQKRLREAQELMAQGSSGAPSLGQQLQETQEKLLTAKHQLQQQQQEAATAGDRPPPGLRRRLDPGHHNSMRKGPEVPRPYAPEQLDRMMNMLLEVAQRYHKEDVRLYHIMMGYYEKIREERIKLRPYEEGGGNGGIVKPPGGLY